MTNIIEKCLKIRGAQKMADTLAYVSPYMHALECS